MIDRKVRAISPLHASRRREWITTQQRCRNFISRLISSGWQHALLAGLWNSLEWSCFTPAGKLNSRSTSSCPIRLKLMHHCWSASHRLSRVRVGVAARRVNRLKEWLIGWLLIKIRICDVSSVGVPQLAAHGLGTHSKTIFQPIDCAIR